MSKNPFSKSDDRDLYSLFVLTSETAVSQQIAGTLQEAGYQVKTATSGQEAISIIDQPPLPDLVILDIEITDMDVAQFLETARQRIGRVAFPSILLIANNETDEVIAHDLQVEDYLQKPFSSEELLTHVWQLLEKKAKN